MCSYWSYVSCLCPPPPQPCQSTRVNAGVSSLLPWAYS